MTDRLLADPFVDVAQAAEHVVVVLERVRVDRAEPDPEVLGVAPELVEVVDAIPGDVQRDRRGEPGVQVDLRRIGELLERVAGDPGLGEDLEAGSGVAERPRRELDGLTLELGGDLIEADHGAPP